MNLADVTIQSINVEITEETEAEELAKEKVAKREKIDDESSGILMWVIIIILVLVAIGGGVAVKRNR